MKQKNMMQTVCNACKSKYYSPVNIPKGGEIGNLTIVTKCTYCRSENHHALDGMYYTNELGILTKAGSMLIKIGASDVTIENLLNKSKSVNLASDNDIKEYLKFLEDTNPKFIDTFNLIFSANGSLKIAIMMFISLLIWYLLTQTFNDLNRINPTIPTKIEKIK